MQNIGMWARSTIGATVDASSDVHPTTAIRFELAQGQTGIAVYTGATENSSQMAVGCEETPARRDKADAP